MQDKPTMTAECRTCSRTFTQPRSRVLRGLARYCSRKCSAQYVYKNPPTLEERFWAKVDKNGPVLRPELGTCWLWTGGKHTGGYGHVVVKSLKQFGRRQIKAHHASWMIHVGPIPDGFWVLHHCDNPPCVRPDHLFLGTDGDNAADKVSKARQRRGEAQPSAKTNAETVRLIRCLAAAGNTHQSIADSVGLSRRTVGMIVSRETWKHIA